MFLWMSAYVHVLQCVVPKEPRGGIRAPETMTGSHTQELRTDCGSSARAASALHWEALFPALFSSIWLRLGLCFPMCITPEKVPRAAGKNACSSVAMSSTLQMSAKPISTTKSLNSDLLTVFFFWVGVLVDLSTGKSVALK